jgi:hypothetical protein
MADIVVKKADNTTNVTYVKQVAAAGDKTDARWQQTAGGSSINLQPYLTVRSQFNGPRTVRRVEGKFGYMNTYTDSTTAQQIVKATVVGSYSFQVPVVTDTTAANEGAAQFGNLLASALMKEVNSTGYAPGS